MSSSRSSGAEPLSSVLAGVLRRVQGGGKPSLEEISAVWKRLVGEEGARHSWPRRLVDRRLVVEVENSGWMYTLGMKRAQLVEGLIELLGVGRVRALTLRIGERNPGEHA